MVYSAIAMGTQFGFFLIFYYHRNVAINSLLYKYNLFDPYFNADILKVISNISFKTRV